MSQLRIIFIFIWLLCNASGAFALNIGQLNAPFSYQSQNQNLQDMGSDIAKILEMTVQIDPKIAQNLINGQWNSANFYEFLDNVSQTHAILWGITNDALYLSPPDEVVNAEFIFATKPKANNFLALTNNQKFRGNLFKISQKSRDNQAIIIAQGPQWWIDKIGNYADIFSQDKSEIIVVNNQTTDALMIFKLVNAWADDKVFSYGNQQIPVRGVVSLLRDMVQLTQPSKNANANNANKNIQPKSNALSALPTIQEAPTEPIITPTTSNKNTNNAPEIIDDLRISADSRQNSVVIKDKLDNYYFYQSLLDILDRPNLMVHIEAHIIDVNTSKITETGLDWSVSAGGNRVSFGAPSAGNVASTITANFNKLGALSKNSFISNLDSVIANFRMLETNGDSKIISSPSVLTMDNNEAVFTTSDSFYVSVQGNSNAASVVVPVSATTLLKVTPHIIQDGQNANKISILVNIDDGAIDTSNAAQVGGLPRVVQNRLTTQAIVSEGEGIAFGGRIYNTKVKSENKVPFLGDIPIIGYAFKNEKSEDREYIRIYIIKPTIKQL